MTEFDSNRRTDGSSIEPERADTRGALMTIGILVIFVIAIATAIYYWKDGAANARSSSASAVTTSIPNTFAPARNANR